MSKANGGFFNKKLSFTVGVNSTAQSFPAQFREIKRELFLDFLRALASNKNILAA